MVVGSVERKNGCWVLQSVGVLEVEIKTGMVDEFGDEMLGAETDVK